MPSKRLWAYERGALWAATLEDTTPTPRPSRAATLSEAAPGSAASLAEAMGLAEPCEVQRRMANGSRCFVARVEGAIAAYGWVSQGIERIGELERTVRMRPDEAYIWDCATLEPFRRQGLYSALLAYIVATLRDEGARRVWIGASLQNTPSLRAFASAGFRPAVTIVFVRFWGLSHAWVMGEPSAPPALVADARWALVESRGRPESA